MRVGKDGRARLREGAAKKTGEEDRCDLKGQRVIRDLALLEEALSQLQGCCPCGGRVHLARSRDGSLVDRTKFLNCLGVDGLQDDKAYAAHGAHLHGVLEVLGEAQLRKNRAAVRAHMIEVHGAEPDEFGRVGIMVSADGSWPI